MDSTRGDRAARNHVAAGMRAGGSHGVNAVCVARDIRGSLGNGLYAAHRQRGDVAGRHIPKGLRTGIAMAAGRNGPRRAGGCNYLKEMASRHMGGHWISSLRSRYGCLLPRATCASEAIRQDNARNCDGYPNGEHSGL